ncbi:MAG: hypothetical protein RTU30_07280, partial [Candidatus Thorarchaeota archaeon]
MNIKELLKNGISTIGSKKRVIFKRLVIYFLILLVASPFVFLYRSQIYASLFIRYDDYIIYTNDEGLEVTDYGYQAGVYIGTKITPRATANVAYRYYDLMEQGNSTVEGFFNNSIDWLLDHRTHVDLETDNGPVEVVHWYYDFAIWDLPVGWYQAMADAKALY